MTSWRWISSVVTCSLAFAGCGGSGGAGPVTVATANLSAARLQFAVGSATFPSPPPGSDVAPANGPILNLVETFRQPNGTSALLNDVVTITGPATFVVGSLNVPAVKNDGGAPNQIINALAGISAFGESFASNANQTGIATTAAFALGYNASAAGPPAFPRTSDGNYPPGFNYASNIVAVGGNKQIFSNGFPLGTYTLRVSTPPGSSESQTWTASAKLATLTLLPVLAAPQLSFDGKGGGSIFVFVPSKITELFVSVSVGNSCWPFEAAINTTTSSGSFSLFVKSPKVGPLTLAVPDNLGPPIANGNAPTFCSSAQNTAAVGFSTNGATATVQAIGVDYPLYEMSYPQSTVQTPPITGDLDPDGHANRQSDVTVSAQTIATAP